MRVLIADDDATTRIFLKCQLERFGHEVVECQTGKDVLGQLFKGTLPQLLFLDWMMPEVSGLEICEHIRQKHELNYTYIVLVTSKAQSEDIILGLRSGADDYLTKPVKLEDFEARLQVAIQMINLNNLVEKQRLNLISASKMAILGEMAGGIAHEINNPLSIILGNADRIRVAIEAGKETLDLQKIKNLCDKISLTTDRIAKIVKSLRTFAGDGEKEPVATINVGALIADALSFCESKIVSHGIQILNNTVSSPIAFEGQNIQFCQVLLNLISNSYLAVKDLNEKWIKFEVSEDSKNVLLAVSDSGHGIPEEIRSKLMQPFFTTRPPGQGTGLGLSISKGIIEAHGGSLSIDSTSLTTRFVITVPKKFLVPK